MVLSGIRWLVRRLTHARRQGPVVTYHFSYTFNLAKANDSTDTTRVVKVSWRPTVNDPVVTAEDLVFVDPDLDLEEQLDYLLNKARNEMILKLEQWKWEKTPKVVRL